MNFSFIDVDLSRVGECPTSRGATLQRSTFLPRYDQPAVRQRVRDQLEGMRRSGFTEIRTIIYSGKAPVSADWFDVVVPDRAARAVRQYIEDVRDAGYSRAILAFGMQGVASPSCRKSEWGDCFDGDAKTNVRFMLAVRRALGSQPPLAMRYDIAPELCAPPSLPSLLRSNLVGYVRSIATMYGAEYPSDETTSSCIASRFAEGQPETDRIFAEAGGGPAYFDIHIYQGTRYNLPSILDRPWQKPLIVGETTYGDSQFLKMTLDQFALQGAQLDAVYFWPLARISGRCHVDVAPPYTLKGASGGLFGPSD